MYNIHIFFCSLRLVVFLFVVFAVVFIVESSLFLCSTVLHQQLGASKNHAAGIYKTVQIAHRKYDPDY